MRPAVGDRIRDALRRRDYAVAARLAETVEPAADPAEPMTVGERFAVLLGEPDDEAGASPADQESAPTPAP
jgi:hypothetical protein